MEITVSNQIKGIDWGVKGTQRIVQNVLNLINTYKYEIAYNRVVGISPELIDKPCDSTIQSLKQEVFELITRFEPRASLKDVRVSMSDIGDILIEVVLEL